LAKVGIKAAAARLSPAASALKKPRRSAVTNYDSMEGEFLVNSIRRATSPVSFDHLTSAQLSITD
jgi:hypothetical protein